MTEQTNRRAWLAVGSIALGIFVMVTTEFLPIGLLSSIARDLQITEGQAGLMVTVPGLVAALAAPVMTIVTRNADRRLLLVGLSTLVMISNLIVALAPNITVVLVGRVLLGLSVGGIWTFAAAVGRRLVQQGDGNRAIAVITTGVSVGTVLGVPVGTAIGELAGWRLAFVGGAGLALAVLIGQWVLLPKLPTRRATTVRDLVGILRVPQAVAGLAAAALIASGHFVAYTYLEPFLAQIARLSPTGVTGTLAGYGIAGVLGTIVAERASTWDVRGAFPGCALLVAAAIFFAVSHGSDAGWAIAFVILWGAAFGAVPVCVQIWIYESAPEQFEVGSAIMVTVFQVALAVGAFAGGLMVDFAGLGSAFILGGSLSLLCGLLILIIRRVSTMRPVPAE